MADLSDVSNALVSLLAQIIYPNGSGNASAVGASCRIYMGWPQSQQLNADLLAGYCHISVFPTQNERNTSRYLRVWQPLPVTVPTLTLTQNNNSVTVGGAVSVCNVALLVQGQNYAYAVKATDTLTSVATALAALITGATSSGAVITLPTNANLQALKIGVGGTMAREVRRQERVFMMAIWSPTAALRDAIAKLIDAALVDMTFMALPDLSMAHVNYKGSVVVDERQKSALYRRDLNYAIEYATTETTGAMEVTQIATNIDSVLDGPATAASTPLVTFTTNI